MPYLEEWSALEEDYSSSLSGATNALLSSSVRLPVSGEVRVRFCLPTICSGLIDSCISVILTHDINFFQADVGQLGEALNSSFKVIESIGSHIQRFIEKVRYFIIDLLFNSMVAIRASSLICGICFSHFQFA